MIDFLYIETQKIFEYISRNDVFLSANIEFTNPLLWELGHAIYFMDHHCLKNTNVQSYLGFDFEKYDNVYDSFINDRKYRFEISDMLTLPELKHYFEYTFNKVIKCKTKYLQHLVVAHFHMHIESFYFTLKANGHILELIKEVPYSSMYWSFDTLEVPTQKILQGAPIDADFSWDNENPCFETNIKAFSAYKNPVTNGKYNEFIESGGYYITKYWSFKGLRWLNETRTTKPLYWNKHKHLIDYPVIHISYYEAEAFCNWYSEKYDLSARLPNESEWEALCQIYGNKDKCNLDYTGGLCSVHENDGINLYGNCWEWCSDVIYPYDGFKIDKYYKEMSYPFFGFKKICKGGSWCCPKDLIHSYYRNAQLPENRVQYIGFRMVF